MTDATDRLLASLFDAGHAVRRVGPLLAGHARVAGTDIAVVGTAGRAAIDPALALALARAVLDVLRDHPGRAILVVTDNAGHKLGLAEELLGNAGYIAHLTKTLDRARRSGHAVIGLVHTLGVSGGFMATGLSTGACYALPTAELRVMAAEAMARVTRIAPDRLAELCAANPVLGAGVANFVRVGGLVGLWDDPRAGLEAALAAGGAPSDERARLGAARGGRPLAAAVASDVRYG